MKFKKCYGILFFALLFATVTNVNAQQWEQKFEQLGPILPTPNEYRTGSGAPGPKYWQQQADYKIDVTLDEAKQQVKGSETVTYHNNSPEALSYLWVQLDQNMRARDSETPLTDRSTVKDNMTTKSAGSLGAFDDFDGGFKITSLTDTKGNNLKYVINKTMMRIDLPSPMKPGDIFEFNVSWWYNINDRMTDGGRSGYEYFPKDDNYLFTIAQFYPRMAVYDDYEGWQNKQFLGQGEFTLSFGDFEVNITVPADHIVASTGELQNPSDVLTSDEIKRFQEAKSSFDKTVIIVTEKEAIKKEKSKSKKMTTWKFKADNVRDFAFASSRKFIWDAQAVKVGSHTPLAMSYYPKEGNPLWEQESTKAVKNTLEIYSKYTIDYPYPVAISVNAASIGMEYPMICFNFGRQDANGKITDRIKWGMIGVVIHEVGHNFFPMIINSDERQWTWMDEGLNTFVQYRTQVERYPDFPNRRGVPSEITSYMKGDKLFIRPIMTNSEQILQFGNNAYAKPATALSILRETIMGPELFDMAFKTYADRWAFKSPKPADFFRTMEDASGVDLDWFWKGWFYTTDHVDIEVSEVKWFKVRTEEEKLEGRVTAKNVTASGGGEKTGDAPTDFSNGPQLFNLSETPPSAYREFNNRLDDKAIIKKLASKNFYEIKFANTGGLVMPLIVEFTFKDGTKERIKVPAEIWRLNESEVSKVFSFEKEVVNIVLDPDKETADTETDNNTFPRVNSPSKFDQFNKK
ncbi:MAG: M1 family metallopeptidase [Cyclobacteriaceae bacterium]|nr:M1 family metallopeptidase [Cyclobacteriaceae bacterium]